MPPRCWLIVLESAPAHFLASCLKCLGCSPELLAAAKHNPGPRIQQQPKPVPLHVFMLQMQLFGLFSFWLFPSLKSSKRLNTPYTGVVLYLFPQPSWTPWRWYFAGIGRACDCQARIVSRNTSAHLAKDHTLNSVPPAMSLPAILISSSPWQGAFSRVLLPLWDLFGEVSLHWLFRKDKKRGVLKTNRRKIFLKYHLLFNSTQVFKNTS